MTTFESKKGKGPRKPHGPGKGKDTGPDIKRPRDEDLSAEDKAILDEERLLLKELYMEKVSKNIKDKTELLENMRAGKDTKTPEKTDEEKEYEKLLMDYKSLVTKAKIAELQKKIEKETAPPKPKTPEDLEYEGILKEYNKAKLQAEMDSLKKKTEELTNARKPKEKSELEKEYEALEKEMKKLEEIHKIENMKAKIAEAKEKVADKAKYLKGKSSGGGWGNFFNIFKSDTSKNVSIGATLALGLLCGALPLLMVGGLMFLIPSDEEKAKKKTA